MKRSRILHVLLGLLLAIVILAIAGIAVLRSQRFHNYVLAKIVEEASQATGGKVEIAGFQFGWSGLRVDLNQITLHGSEPAGKPPLLQVDHLSVGLKLLSLRHRQVNLSEIVIDHPIINMSVDPRGTTNLPQPPSPPGSSQANVFDLAIGHLAIHQGDLKYNDRHIPLNGELHDFYADVSFNSFTTEYAGTLGYHDGKIQFGTYNPLQHNLDVHFGATPTGLKLDSAVLNAGSSTVTLHGELQDYSNPTVDGSYQAALSTGEMGKVVKANPLPVGQVNLQGTLHFTNRAGQPPINNLTMSGHFQSPALAVSLPQARTSVGAVSGEYSLSDGTLEARNVRAEVLGGGIAGNLTVANLAERPQANLKASMRDISLAALSTLAGANRVRRASITGKITGTLQGSWEGSGDRLQVRTDATISASAPVHTGANAAGPATHNAIPLEGAVHVAYNSQGVISVSHSVLATPQTIVNLDGGMGSRSNLTIRMHSGDLRELDQIALIVRQLGETPGKPSTTAIEPFDISGTAAFDGRLSGTLTNPQLTGQITSSDFEYQDIKLNALRFGLAMSPSNVALTQGVMQSTDQGQVQFNLSAGLNDWQYTPQSPIHIDLNAAQLPVATVEKIARLQYPVTGTLAARISLHGSQSNLAGQGNAVLTQATAWNQPIQSLRVQFQGAGTSINSTFSLQSPAGPASGKLSYNLKTQEYDAQLSAPSLQLDKLTAVNQAKTPLSGVITASLQGRGTVKDPQLNASIQAPKLRIGQQELEGLNIRGNVAQQKATLTLNTTSQGASIQGQANVKLDANYNSTASVDVKNVQLGPLLTTYFPKAPEGLHGQTEMHATLHGPLKQRDQVRAEINIPTLNLAYQSLQIANASPIHAVYDAGDLILDHCELKGTGTDLQLQATVPLEHTGTMQGKASGDLDIHLLQLLYPSWDSSGKVSLDLAAAGTMTNPDVHGTLRLVDAEVQPPDAPLGAQKLNATLTLQNGRIDIQQFTGEAGGGTLSATGFATIQPSVQFTIRLAANRVRLRYPVGTRAVLDSTLILSGSSDNALLTGQVTVDSLSLTKEFDISTFADQFTGSSASASGPSFADNIRLNVALRSATNMDVANSQLSIQGSASLMVQGTAADPVILGRTDITSGELYFNGQRYQVQNAVISFANPTETQPVVNLHVTTTVQQFDITLNLEGPIDRLRVSYTSDPPLAPVDIINLVATGQTTEAAAQTPSTPQSVIAGQLTSQVSNRVQKLAGISSLTIDPQMGSGEGNGAARVAVQQRVTKNLHVAFSTQLTNSEAQTVQVEYQVTKRFSVSTMRDENGIYTFQVKMHKSF